MYAKGTVPPPVSDSTMIHVTDLLPEWHTGDSRPAIASPARVNLAN